MKRLGILLWSVLLTVCAYGQRGYRNWQVSGGGSQKYLALIIGNNDYDHATNLQGPVSSGKLLEKALERKGFDVLVGYNQSKVGMRDLVDDFGDKVDAYEFGMIVYMGHGFEIEGKNYLLPVETRAKRKSHISGEALSVDYVTTVMNGHAGVPKVLLFDACRNDPFSGVNNGVGEMRDWGNHGGFSEISAPVNSAVLYTVQKSSVVRDDNPYMQYFIEEFGKQACLDDIVRTVSKRVVLNNRKQIPASYGQLLEKVCFDDGEAPRPVLDSDGDGVEDEYDRCPTERGPKSNNGCPEEEEAVYVDNRDGERYKTVRIGNQVWMSENMRYKISGSYLNPSNRSKAYGRLYTWEQAKRVCPKGWHLPSDEEWKVLERHLGMSESDVHEVGYRGEIGGQLKSISGWDDQGNGSNSSGFNAFPAGYYSPKGFEYLGENAFFWSSTGYSGADALHRDLDFQDNEVYRDNEPKTSACSCRCLKD